MSEPTIQEVPHKGCRKPHVLVVDCDEDYAWSIVSALRECAICSKSTRTVDAFLDLHCQARVDLVLLEVDPLDPEGLDHLRSLRTYFGEGPGTRIVATSIYAPTSFQYLAGQRGADTHTLKKRDPNDMVAVIKAELSKQTDLR